MLSIFYLGCELPFATHFTFEIFDTSSLKRKVCENSVQCTEDEEILIFVSFLDESVIFE